MHTERECIMFLMFEMTAGTASRGSRSGDGLRPVQLSPSSPELQPAEYLWPLVDDPVANGHVERIADFARRCLTFGDTPDFIYRRTRFHWWPNPAMPHQ